MIDLVSLPPAQLVRIIDRLLAELVPAKCPPKTDCPSPVANNERVCTDCWKLALKEDVGT